MTKAQYNKELRSKNWKFKREKIIERDGKKCLNCGSKKNLQVHHTIYKKGKRAWEYEDFTLMTLCSGCHLDHHENGIDLSHISSALKREYLDKKREKQASKKQSQQSQKETALLIKIDKLIKELSKSNKRIEELEKEVFGTLN